MRDWEGRIGILRNMNGFRGWTGRKYTIRSTKHRLYLRWMVMIGLITLTLNSHKKLLLIALFLFKIELC